MLRNLSPRHQPAATAPLDRNSAAAAPLDCNSAAAAPPGRNSAAAAPPDRNSAATAPPGRDSAVAVPQLPRHHTAATRHCHPSAAAAPLAATPLRNNIARATTIAAPLALSCGAEDMRIATRVELEHKWDNTQKRFGHRAPATNCR